jgi:hypothetical protein
MGYVHVFRFRSGRGIMLGLGADVPDALRRFQKFVKDNPIILKGVPKEDCENYDRSVSRVESIEDLGEVQFGLDK